MGTVVHWPQSQSPHFSPPQGEARHPANLVRIRPVGWPENSLAPPAANASVDRLWFLGEPAAVQRRLIKAIAAQAGLALEFSQVDEILRFAAEPGPAGKELALPLGWKLLRELEEIIFVAPDGREQSAAGNYEYALPVPGCVLVKETGSEFAVRVIEQAGGSPAQLDCLLQTESLGESLTLRNWRAGDRFWPAHTKAPKKLKELLTDLRVARAARATWPVIASGDDIVWVRGFSVSSKYRAKAGRSAVSIHETPVSSNESA